jgi:hypothetical protein
LMLLLLMSQVVTAQVLTGLESQPQNAVETTIKIFNDYPVVAIGENHSLKELGEFYIALIRHPDFAKNVGNVVFEFGNSFYQPLVDRYLNGEDVAYEEVKKAWTTLIATGGSNEISVMYGQFYEAIREIKVWLGDPPASPDDPSVYSENFPDRDAFYANVVTQDILAKGKKALVIIGAGHFIDYNDGFYRSSATVEELNNRKPYEYNIVAFINGYYPGKMFTIQVHWGLPNQSCNQKLEAELAAWSPPFLLLLRDTSLAKFLDSEECKIGNDWGLLTRAWADGFLYLGQIEELAVSPLPDEIETSYLEGLLERFPTMKEQWK